tara:strand:+ start:24183 stop:24413 length:231 start_codon:yes stop_codon:yes gene_type:complete
VDYKYRQACWEYGYFVVLKPTEKGYKKGGHDVTLYIDYKGKSKMNGKQLYKQNSIELENKIEEAYKYCYNFYILGL